MPNENLAVWIDTKNHPVGTMNGDPNMGVASNYRIPPARIYVVNHTRTRPWSKLAVSASFRRGAEDVLIYNRELAKIYNVDTLTKRIEQGKSHNQYKKGIHVGVFDMTLGKRHIAITPARDAESKPAVIEVPEGLWDIYLGNYERMRSEDPKVVSDERSRLAVRWRARHNPVFCYTDDEVTKDLGNEYGFLEFIRVPQRAMVDQVDKEYLAALDLIEAV